MQKNLISIFLIFQILVAPLAQAASQCEMVFEDKISVVRQIRKINEENNKFFDLALGQNLLLDYPMEQKRFFRRLVNNLQYKFGLKYDRNLKLVEVIQKYDLAKVTTSLEIEQLASELSLALFGPRHLVIDYLLKSRDDRFRHSALSQISESLLRKGLIKTWIQLGHKNQNLWQRFKNSLWRFQKHGLIQFLTQLPFPHVKDKKIPDELMNKVILEGFDAHQAELQVALGTQGPRDTYNTFRKVALVLFYVGMIGGQIIEAKEQQYKAMEQSRIAEEKQVEALQNLAQQIEENTNQAKRAIFESAFEQAKKDFLLKWGENPTLEEEQVLYGLITVSAFSDP